MSNLMYNLGAVTLPDGGQIQPQCDDKGNAKVIDAQAAATSTRVAMNGTWVKVWTAAAAKRVIIGFPTDSGATGDYTFDATLAGLTTSAGIPLSAGSGGSFDFGGGAVPNSDIYVKATSGSYCSVQVFA